MSAFSNRPQGRGRGPASSDPLALAGIALLATMAVILRFFNLGQRPLMHDESLFAYYAYVAMQSMKNGHALAGAYVHMPMLHGPTLIMLTSKLFSWLGDSIAVGRGMIAVLSLVAVAASASLWPRRSRLWMTSLMLTSPILLFYSRFFRNEMLFCAVLMLGMVGVARGLSRRPTQAFWSILGVALIMALLAIKENAVFVHAAGLTFGAFYVALRLAGRLAPSLRSWIKRALRPRPRPSIGLAGRGTQNGRIEPTALDVFGSLDASWPPTGDPFAGIAAPTTAAMPSSVHDRQGWIARHLTSLMSWMTGVAFGLLILAWVYGRLAGQADGVAVRGNALSGLGKTFHEAALRLGWLNLKASWDYWNGQHQEQRIGGPLHYHLPILLAYELPLLALAYLGVAWDALERRGRVVLHVLAMGAWLALWGVWRSHAGPMEPDATAGVGLPAKVIHFLHLAPNGSVLALGILIVPLLIWSFLKLIEHRPLAAWMGWWAACSLFQYSAAGEKVPWLTVHVVLPLYLMTGWIWGPLLARHGRAARAVFIALAALGTVVGWRADLRFLGDDQANPRERLVYNHTTADFDAAIKDRLALWGEFDAQTPLARRRVLMVDDPGLGGPSWPGYWYLRHVDMHVTTTPEAQIGQGWDLVVGTKQAIDPLLARLDRARWSVRELSLRDHWIQPWPEEARWRDWANARSRSQNARSQDARRPPLWPLLKDSMADLWRYDWDRQTWTDPGHFPIVLLDPLHSGEPASPIALATPPKKQN
jgi:uncharacterized protein (TIGR03663 family)